MNHRASNIDDAIVTLLLRMRRSGSSVSLRSRQNFGQRDLPFLRQFWAASPAVAKFVEYVLAHAHEARAVLQFQRNSEAGVPRGRLDATETLRQQAKTGNPALLVAHEAIRSYENGLNHLVVWVLEEARRHSRQMLQTTIPGSAYEDQFSAASRRLEQASRIESIRSAAAQVDLRRRPVASTISQARRSRTMLYRFAADAFIVLQAVERGDESAVRDLLQHTLLGPLETWRRFELLVAVAMGDALSCALGLSCELSASFSDEEGVLMRVGSYCIHWQAKTKYYVTPALEPSEHQTNEILSALGMRIGWDRPDVVVTNSVARTVVAVAEVKYFSAAEADGRDAVRAAVDQLVRYVRGYKTKEGWASLLTHSLVVPVLQGFAVPQPKAEGVPWIFDLKSIQAQGLNSWSHALTAVLPTSQEAVSPTSDLM